MIQIFRSACRKCLEGLFRKFVRYQKKFISMLKILNSFQYAEEHITSVKQGNLEHIFTRDFHKKGYPQTLKVFTHTTKHSYDPHPC